MTGAFLALRESTSILLAIVAFCAIYANWNPIRSMPAVDFYQFWLVGQEVSAGEPGNVYSDSVRERIGRHALNRARAAGDRNRIRTAEYRSVLETYSTPFLYTVFGSFSTGDYERDLSRYRTLSLACLLLAVAVLCRLLGYGLVPAIAAITLFGSWFAPSRSDMVVGNVNHFQLLWLVLFFWLSRRFPTSAGHLAGGILLGVGAMFKPNTALMVGLLVTAWLIRRRHKKLIFEMVGIAAGSFAAFAWSSAAFGGAAIWREWSWAVSNLPEGIMTVELGNYAPARLLRDALQIDATWPIALVCGVLALVGIARGLSGAASEGAHDQPGLEDIHVAAMAGLMTLLASPLAWLHYFVAVIPMLLVTLRSASRGQADGALSTIARVAALVALVTIMMQPLVMLELGDLRSRAILLCGGVALLFGLGLRELVLLRSGSFRAPDRA